MSKTRLAMILISSVAVLACGDDGGDGTLAGQGGPVGGATAGAVAGAAGAAGMASAGTVAGAGGEAGMATAGTAAGSGVAGAMAGTAAAGTAAAGMAAAGTAAAGTGATMNCVGPTTAEPPQPTFTWIFDNVVPNCAGPVCHGSIAGGMLVLDTKENSYAQLMMAGMGLNLGASMSDVDCVDTGMMRVVPNDPDASLFYAKLRTDVDPPCGNRMPTGSQLCPDVIEVIRMWIANGAENN